MGRIHITSYKEFAIATPTKSIEWKVYSDALKQNLIHTYVETDDIWFNEFRFNVDVNGEPYMVTADTRAEFRIIDFSGESSAWIEVLPTNICID